MKQRTAVEHALLVIDVQKALVKGAFREHDVMRAIGIVIDKVRSRGGIIVYIQHCHRHFEPLMKGKPGWDLHELLDVREEDFIVEKEASDAFYQSGLDEVLQQAQVDHLYVTGLQTEYCVDATCRSALSKGYNVTLVSDGHTTGDAILSAKKTIEHHNFILANLAHPDRSVQVMGSAEI